MGSSGYGWIKFVRSKELRLGDRVIVYEEQEERGLMQLKIKVEKQTSPSEARCSPVMNQNLDGNKGSTSYNNDNEATATFQPFGDISEDVLNHDIGGITAATTSNIDKEQIPTPHSTSPQIAHYKMERPSLNLSLELALKPTMTGGRTAATSSSIDKEQTTTFHNTSPDIACYKTPSLSLSLGWTLKQTMTGCKQHAYMQEIDAKTIDFLGRFL